MEWFVVVHPGIGDRLCKNALAIDSTDTLYAGGDFTTAGGVSANYIAKWDGESWSALGSGMGGFPDSPDPYVNVLVFDASGTLLYTGGRRPPERRLFPLHCAVQYP